MIGISLKSASKRLSPIAKNWVVVSDFLSEKGWIDARS